MARIAQQQQSRVFLGLGQTFPNSFVHILIEETPRYKNPSVGPEGVTDNEGSLYEQGDPIRARRSDASKGINTSKRSIRAGDASFAGQASRFLMARLNKE